MPQPFQAAVPVILASASPRRQQFLADLGIAFRVVRPAGIEPRPLPGQSPEAYALTAACAKAHGVSHTSGTLLLAADTVVALGSRILGKPRDDNDALAMLRMLAGKKHRVISAACCILPDGRETTLCDTTHVHVHPWPDAVLAAYARTGEPADKAGAYAVQGMGAFLLAGMEGSWATVVGLPLAPLVALLLKEKIIRIYGSARDDREPVLSTSGAVHGIASVPVDSEDGTDSPREV